MIEEIFNVLEEAQYLSTLDLFTGYWPALMFKCFHEKTTFLTRYGTYEFSLITFGLVNALETFQKMMDDVLKGLDFVRIYLD